MTKQEAIDELYNMTLGEGEDREGVHERADAILCEYLCEIGHANVANAFRDTRQRLDFWYG